MSALVGNFKIYPRGFLGAKLEPFLVKKPQLTGNSLYDVMLTGGDDEKAIVANLKLEDLYQNMARNDLNIKRFDFKEDVLSTFMKAFGTISFGEWYMAQFQSPSFGPMHQRFLDDTLSFLMGNRREMAIQSWEEIMDESEHRMDRIEVSKRTQDFFGTATTSKISGSMMIEQVVHDWMRRDGGFTDLLTTGHILFGIKD